MAYFANGTQGDWYEQNICTRCAHYDDAEPANTCTIWVLHLLYNGADEESEVGQMLQMLIPQRGIYQDLCSMFQPAKPDYAELPKQYQAWLEAQAKR